MPYLLTLSGEPLSWPELHTRNEAWWALHGPDGYGTQLPPLEPRALSMNPTAVYMREWRKRRKERAGDEG